MGKIIKFPAHKARKPAKPKPKVSAEKTQIIKENIFIEQLVEDITLHMIHLLQEKEYFLANL